MTKGAYSANWFVRIQPEGNLTDDVARVTIVEEEDRLNSATVVLDESKRNHILEEGADMTVSVEEGTTDKIFEGQVDSVDDDVRRPRATVEGREPAAALEDASAVEVINKRSLFAVIDALVDASNSEVRNIFFDVGKHRDRYGFFANSTIFGKYEFDSATDTERFNTFQDVTNVSGDADRPIGFDFGLHPVDYENDTGTDFELTVIGTDRNGDEVAAVLVLPTGQTSSVDAFGKERVRPDTTEGGTGRFHDITRFNINPDPATVSGTFRTRIDFVNFVPTTFTWTAQDNTSVRGAIREVLDVIEAEDGRDWEQTVKPGGELLVRPVSQPNRTRFRAVERQNVQRPVANISLDDVGNFVHVSGKNQVEAWAYAWQGDFYSSTADPKTNGLSIGSTFETSPGGNDIDEIDLRNPDEANVQNENITDNEQARSVAERALESVYRTAVSGSAPYTGVKEISTDDELEVIYPSRGIPARVSSNIFDVKRVEWRMTDTEATTVADFEQRRTDADEAIVRAILGTDQLTNEIDQRIQADVFQSKIAVVEEIVDDVQGLVNVRLPEEGELFEEVNVAGFGSGNVEPDTS